MSKYAKSILLRTLRIFPFGMELTFCSSKFGYPSSILDMFPFLVLFPLPHLLHLLLLSQLLQILLYLLHLLLHFPLLIHINLFLFLLPFPRFPLLFLPLLPPSFLLHLLHLHLLFLLQLQSPMPPNSNTPLQLGKM